MTVYVFGPFRLDEDAGTLFRGTEPLATGQRAVAVLHPLLAAAGAPVSKDALISSAWPGLAVEESNLTVQIAALRRVFEAVPGGERWIETLPRRGYRYVGPSIAVQGSDSTAGLRTLARPSPVLPDKPSIAALPFTNMSGDPEQEYFADGMVEDIVTGLSRIKGLLVVARNSSFTYKGKAVNAGQVGRELGVRYLLEGSVRKAGAHVRITAQLIEAESGAHLWAERYDRPLDDVFAIQDEITLSVIGAIEPSLREAEIERVKRKRPDNLIAYDLVLRALPHVFIAMPGEAAKAMSFLERALAIEADYAIAHGFLAWCHQISFVRGGFKKESRDAAIRHARAAVTNGRDDATALALGAFIIATTERDRETAFDAFERALRLSPSSSITLFFGAAAFAYSGQAERAIEWAERGLRLSPFDRLDYAAYNALATAHFLRGRYEDAVNAARRALRSAPNLTASRIWLAAALVKVGQLDEARAVAREIIALQPSFSAGKFCEALGLVTALAEAMSEAWIDIGLPA